MSSELSDMTLRYPGPAGSVTEVQPGAQAVLDLDDLHVSIRPGPPPVVEISGEIDIWSGQQLRDQLLWVMRRHGAQLTLDLGRVTFMDCAGIGVLLATRRRARLQGGWVRIVRVSPRVQRIFALANVQQVLMPLLPHQRRS